MFGKLVRGALRLRGITEQTRQSIGRQAWARLMVANRVLNGHDHYELIVGGAISFAENDSYECGFLSESDALDFFDQIRTLKSISYRPSFIFSYREDPDSYRLDGWSIRLPARCNAKFCEDWNRYPDEVPLIDLGAIQANDD